MDFSKYMGAGGAGGAGGWSFALRFRLAVDPPEAESPKGPRLLPTTFSSDRKNGGSMPRLQVVF